MKFFRCIKLMRLSINNNDLSIFKHGECVNCTFNDNPPGLCGLLPFVCLKDSKIFYRTSYNSSIFNL